MQTLRAGRLRHTISFVLPTVTGQNSFGENIITNVDVGTFPCLVESYIVALLPSSQSTYRIVLRKQPGITFTRRMIGTFGSRTLQILDVCDLGESLRPQVVLIASDVTG